MYDICSPCAYTVIMVLTAITFLCIHGFTIMNDIFPVMKPCATNPNYVAMIMAASNMLLMAFTQMSYLGMSGSNYVTLTYRKCFAAWLVIVTLVNVGFLASGAYLFHRECYLTGLLLIVCPLSMFLTIMTTHMAYLKMYIRHSNYDSI